MQLVLDTKNIQLLKNGGTFEIVSEGGKRQIAPAKLSSIAITANVMLEAAAVRLAIQHQIPILFFNYIGKAQARLWSPYFESIASLRRQQLRFTESPEATAWMIDVFLLKTEGQVASLRFLRKRSTRIASGLDGVIRNINKQSRNFERYRDQLPEEARNNLMGVEGAIARQYWQGIGNALPKRYAFQKRSRRPAEDAFNALLNYCYGMLYSVVEGGIFAAGLDPYLGILHADEYKKPTLAFDLIEVFRPWIDQLLIQECTHLKIEKNFFTKNQHGLYLNKTGKAYIIPLFNDFLRSERKFQQRESSVKNHIHFIAGQLAQRIRTY
ncbi:MAG: CRISPR-associated endonuclease Cas1 [Bacteroidota bacterium]